MCHLLTLLGTHHILHVSRIRVNVVDRDSCTFVILYNELGRTAMGLLSCVSIRYSAICAVAPRNTVKTSVRLDDSWGPASKSVSYLCDVAFHLDATSLTRRWFRIIYFIRLFFLVVVTS